MPNVLRAIIALASLLPALAGAAPVRIFVAGAAKAAVEALLPGFERAGGDTVAATYDTAGALRDRVLQGERPDLVILSDAAIDAIAAHGLLAGADRRELGVVVVGLAVRQGAALPDISTPDALRRTLLSATAVGYADPAHGATSGAQFEKAIAGLGLRAQIAGKTTVLPTGGEVLQGVARGKFEVGVSQSSEILPVPGVTFVGGLPRPYDLRTPYAMVVLVDGEPARRLLRYLGTADALAQFEASGFAAR